MTSFVKIEDGVIVQKQPYFEDDFIEAPDEVVCGFLFDGHSFFSPPIPEPEPPGLPNLEPYQFHAMVALTGYTADIEAAINADPDPTFKAAAWAKYRYSTYYKRKDPFVVALGAAVGVSPEQLDALWLDATGF